MQQNMTMREAGLSRCSSAGCQSGASLRRCASSPAFTCWAHKDSRGSAILLVLVSIVLMAILAGSLLQVTRFERIPQPAAGIEVVLSSVEQEILNQATNDLLDANGNLFNIIATTGNANQAGDEPWDFPYTRPTIYPGARQAESIDGTTFNVAGGIADDTWLASTAPDFRTAGTGSGTFRATGTVNSGSDTTNGMWRHITDLTGMYLTNAAGGSNLTAEAAPTEQALTAANLATYKTNIPAREIDDSNNVLVDADGDGIGDSRWEWAPLRQIGTTRYVMAVRIVDLSARMDLNVATGVATGSDSNSTRGDTPAEMDGTGAVGLLASETGSGLSSTTVQTEWRNVLGFRLTGNTATSVTGTMNYDGGAITPTALSRKHYWDRGGSLVGTDFVRNGEDGGATFDYTSSSTFGLTDAFELLYRNGLNNATNAAIEDRMPTFLRRNAGDELDWVATSTTVTSNSWSKQQFWELDARKTVSPFTGSMAISRHPASTYAATDGEYKFNLNWNRDNNKYFQWINTPLRTRWMNVASASTSSSLRTMYPHLSGRGEWLPQQLSVNIPDYMDRDNRITIANNRAGFEALPYITEVYTQRPYQVRAAPTVRADGSKDVVWEPVNNDTGGYAIEIGNPFGTANGSGAATGRPISLENIWLKLGSNAAIELSSLSGMPATLNPGEVVIVYRNSTGGTGALDNIPARRWATPSGNNAVAAAVVGPALPGSGNMTISLHAMQQGTSTTPLGWYYSACEIQAPTGNRNENLGATYEINAGELTYLQSNYQGVADGLRMMTTHPAPQSSNARGFGDDIVSFSSPSINHVEGNPATSTASVPQLDGSDGTSTAIPPEFTNESKTNAPTGFSELDGQQIVWHDNPRDRIQWTGDLMQIPLIGPEYRDGTANNRTMAQIFYKAAGNSTTLSHPILGTGVNALLLPYKTKAITTTPKMNTNTGTNIGDTFGIFNLPHSLMLLEQVAANQPATDRKDGDGDGFNERRFDNTPQPDYDETLVAGKINLNTASKETIERVLPLPTAAIRTAVAEAIIARRESLTQATDWNIGANNVPGIQYIGSLYEQIQELPSNPSGTSNAGDTQTINGVRVDLNHYEDSAGTFNTTADGVADDREEELMFAKWLHEVADVRSDVFAAYIVVQGYNADNFSIGPVEAAREIIIFSRASVQGPGDQAIILGRLRIQ